MHRAGKCLGDFYALTEKKWKKQRVVALEEANVIHLPIAAIVRKINEYASNPQAKEILDLLSLHFPLMGKVGKYKTRFVSSFKVMVQG